MCVYFVGVRYVDYGYLLLKRVMCVHFAVTQHALPWRIEIAY